MKSSTTVNLELIKENERDIYWKVSQPIESDHKYSNLNNYKP